MFIKGIVDTTDQERTELVQTIAQRTHLPVLSESDSTEPAIKVQNSDGLPLVSLTGLRIDNQEFPDFSVDFSQPALLQRATNNRQFQQTLVRAIGAKKNDTKNTPLSVLDLTAGLARDSFILAAAGCDVTMVENNPIVFSLVENAILRASEQDTLAPIVERMHLIYKDSLDYLAEIGASQQFDVVYIDPMFPDRKSSAKVKKDMQIMHLITKPSNELELLDAAREMQCRRIVVKRPIHAPILDAAKPVGNIKSKTVRYDIYAAKKLS